MTVKSGVRVVGAVKNIPMEWCELCGALNLFGCCCQANEVREWGQPGGGRGQPRASTACQAAVLQGSCPGPHCRFALAHLWHLFTSETVKHGQIYTKVPWAAWTHRRKEFCFVFFNTLFTFPFSPTRPPGGRTDPTSCQWHTQNRCFSACINMSNFWNYGWCVCVAVDAVFPGHNSNYWVILERLAHHIQREIWCQTLENQQLVRILQIHSICIYRKDKPYDVLQRSRSYYTTNDWALTFIK